jgi:excisionase family DNA binding protein
LVAVMSTKEENVTTASTSEPRLLGINEVAAMLGISKQRVRHLVKVGAIPAVRFAGSGYHRFRPEDIEVIVRGEPANSP